MDNMKEIPKDEEFDDIKLQLWDIAGTIPIVFFANKSDLLESSAFYGHKQEKSAEKHKAPYFFNEYNIIEDAMPALLVDTNEINSVSGP